MQPVLGQVALMMKRNELVMVLLLLLLLLVAALKQRKLNVQLLVALPLLLQQMLQLLCLQ